MRNESEMGSLTKTSFGQTLHRWILSPSKSITEVGAQRKAEISAALSLVLAIAIVIGTLVPAQETRTDMGVAVRIVSAVFFLISYVLSRSRYYFVGAWITVLSLSISPFVLVINGGANDAMGSLLSFGVMALILGILLLSLRGFLVVVGAISLASFLLTIYLNISAGIAAGGILMTAGVLLSINALVQRNIERARLSELQRANAELTDLRLSLAARVADRTRDLALSAEVSRRLSMILDLNELVLQVVDQVKAAFNYYHVHIYLRDAQGQRLEMAGGTGEVGRQMLAGGHGIPLGKGLVGRAARTNQVVFVPDTTQEPDWLPNPLLPETKAEIAVPLHVGEEILGVLDVQHNVVNGLTEDDVSLLQSLGNQVAIAIQNARRYVQTQESEVRLKAIIDAVPTAVMITRISDGVVLYANDNAAALFDYPRQELIGNMTPNLYYSQKDRETVLGILGREGKLVNYEVLGRRRDGSAVWVTLSVQKMDYAGEPSFYVNATDITQQKQAAEATLKRAERDRVLNRITAKIRNTVSIEQVLHLAAQEARQAVGASRSVIMIDPKQEADAKGIMAEQDV